MGLFWPFVRAQAQMQALPMLRRSEVNTTSYVADYLTRSVRRASGFVLVGKPEAIRTNHTKRVSSIVETSRLHSLTMVSSPNGFYNTHSRVAPAFAGTFRHLLSPRKSTRLNSSHLGISYAVFC